MEKLLAEKPSLVSYFIFEVNTLLDSAEQRDSLDFKEAREAAEKGELIWFLKNKYNDLIDLSLFEGEKTLAFNKQMAMVAEGLHNRERRKMGIEKNGLCLLVAYATEISQEINTRE